MEWNGSILIAAFVAAFGILVTMRNHYVDFCNQKIEEKKNKIKKQLQEFYVPVLSNLQLSKALSRQLFIGKPEDFNILTYLLDSDFMFKDKQKVKLTEQEKKLLDEIIKVSENIKEIIIKSGGLVDDTRLTINYKPDKTITDVVLDQDNMTIGLFGLLLSHYKILSLAKDGIIEGDVKYYQQFKFPREIVSILEDNYTKLMEELKKDDLFYLKLQEYILLTIGCGKKAQ